MEPEQLRRGREFHRLVQADWAGSVEDATVRPEHTIRLTALPRRGTRNRRGRIDIFIDQLSGFVTVVEIKATNWDAVKSKSRRKLLGSHRRQIIRYVDKYLEVDNVSVVAILLYPSPPATPGLRNEVEEYFAEHGLQLAWHSEQPEGRV